MNITKQPQVSSTVKSRQLSLFGHMARMDGNIGKADVNQIHFEVTLQLWRKLPGDRTPPLPTGSRILRMTRLPLTWHDCWKPDMQPSTDLSQGDGFAQHHALTMVNDDIELDNFIISATVT